MRLKQKHSKLLYENRPALDPAAIIASQSPMRAAIAALAVFTLITLAAMLLASLTGRVFPWIVLVQGAIMGIAIRRWGNGFDWRFPALGGSAALAGAYLQGFLIAANVAGEALGVSTISVILNMSEYTLGTYFAEDVTPADHIFAVIAAALSAFFSRRQMSRDEYRAIRLMKQAKHEEMRKS